MNTFSHNYKLTIAYDGTQYSGWQVQPNAVSIQSIIQKAIQTIIRNEVVLIGSGRTDAGVHAVGQVAHFKCHTPIDLYRFMASINGLLPFDIRILKIEEVSLDFHAQYSVVSKTYHYHISLGPVQVPFRRFYSLHVRNKLDLDLLQKAASLFIGTHNFTSFANEAHRGSASRDPIRTLERLDIVLEEEGFRLEFQADGFLYKMVRTITGTLLDISRGVLQVEEIAEIFAAADRRCSGPAAPAHGLFLVQVDYPNTPSHLN